MPPTSDRRKHNFYERVFDPEELWAASQVEGIDDDIAMLRVALVEQMKNDPERQQESYDAMVKNAALIVRAVTAKYRMSPQSSQDFAEQITAVLRSLVDQMAPWIAGDGDV